MEHLRSHGHRRIGLIGGPPLLPGSRARQAGWRDALNEIGDGQGVQAVAPFTRLGGLEAGLQLLSGPDRPSALFVSSDIQSIGVLRACAQLDLRVPDEVALISFDGTQAAEFTAPPLTVIHQPVDLIATAALDMLLAPTAQHKVVVHSHSPRVLWLLSKGSIDPGKLVLPERVTAVSARRSEKYAESSRVWHGAVWRAEDAGVVVATKTGQSRPDRVFHLPGATAVPDTGAGDADHL
ncbi:substrate-binding domain-containing protein [Fodinicola feengrottensis]|uniref:substrate-binding domain-containing protein n=1 Tax=Fodinicola feengrottensis TaxID=435914 RepID=UPI0013D65A3E|nr:substrate-binding domain-containing protein [Fodinicola feengrottensis]